ncbi:hypothetical protein BZB76_4889 [Actinomadura pelletieri DSM 43383]|uniref:LPXTG-motif cell wall-anchored protein n=1 Tax=Actinomadura pelletieri DSM 43383 TaxID=1120940 RepID=A0A495QJ45_9ACTN|nr:hypothetical protein [Actinomadura pelletieri]RKS72076.1 hypothetical protein BZB76_4889 [Actinomadura pelletieri DSM 43383]
MNISVRRIAASGTTVLALAPALALTASPAHAQIDLDAVAEGITESGYYVDSRAKYYRTDGAQELLRSAQGRSVPVFVAVVPAGEDAGQIVKQLPALVKRKGTYVVLAGDQLKASSNTLPDAQVQSVYSTAVQGSKGKPDLALLRFVRTLPESKYAPPKPGKPGNNGKPAPESQVQQQEERTLAQSQPTAPAAGYVAAEEKDGGSAMPFVLTGAGVAAVVAAGGGFLLWRRRSATPAPAAAGHAPAAGGPAPGAPAPGGQAPGAQASAEAPKPEGPQQPEPPKNA